MLCKPYHLQSYVSLQIPNHEPWCVHSKQLARSMCMLPFVSKSISCFASCLSCIYHCTTQLSGACLDRPNQSQDHMCLFKSYMQANPAGQPMSLGNVSESIGAQLFTLLASLVAVLKFVLHGHAASGRTSTFLDSNPRGRLATRS